MQLFLDFLPVIAFVIGYWLSDFQTAVKIIMVAVLLQVAITWLIKRTVNKMLLMSAALVIGLGGISLLLQNELVFKWKPTVLYWLFAAIFLGSQFVGDKTIVERLLRSVAKDEFPLTRRDWEQLNVMWVLYFIVAGIANIYVAYRFSEAFWVNFKLFGLIGLTVVFVLVQAIWLSRREAVRAAEANQGD